MLSSLWACSHETFGRVVKVGRFNDSLNQWRKLSCTVPGSTERFTDTVTTAGYDYGLIHPCGLLI